MASIADHGRTALFQGGCQCGAVRYNMFAYPEDIHLCHCRMCQRAVGGPFAALAPVKHQDFCWTQGQPASFQSSSLAIRDFCATCGTPLSFRYIDGDWINLTIGSLDLPEKFPPSINLGVESRLPWLETIQALKSETTEQNMTNARKVKMQCFQKLP